MQCGRLSNASVLPPLFITFQPPTKSVCRRTAEEVHRTQYTI